MQIGKIVWVINHTEYREIVLSGDNSLPLIFETKEEADELVEKYPSFEVEECFLIRKSDLDLDFSKMKIGDGYAVLEILYHRLKALKDWSAPTIKELLDSVAKEYKLKFSEVAQPLRVAISGSMISPPIDKSLELLKAQSTLYRIRRCLDIVESK